MAMLITDKCTGCDACREECPTGAITTGRPYTIDPLACVECVSFHDEPECVAMCPISNCIIPDPNHVESREQLEEKAARLDA
jgi:ferredoxin